MAWRFRKSFKLLPGVRVNVSKSGISTSIGAAPFTLNIGPRGAHATASLPGTGFSIRHRIGAPAHRAAAPHALPASRQVAPPSPPTPAAANLDPGEPIRSAGADAMTSPGLAGFRDLLLQAGKACAELTAEIAALAPKAAAIRARQQRWERGFLFKRLRQAAFARLCEEAETAEAHLRELQEQLELARLSTEIAVAPEVAAPYARLCDAFAAMAQSSCIWDALARTSAGPAADRTAVSELITRERVAFRQGQSDILRSEWAVPVLENRSGGDIYLYPGFVLYRAARDSFAVIDVRDVTVEYAPSRFVEPGPIPPDAPTVGHTWLKVNKDGGPDRRFKGNLQIPIVLYGTLRLRSSTGLNEEYLVSNPARCEAFANAWADFKNSFAASAASADRDAPPN